LRWLVPSPLLATMTSQYRCSSSDKRKAAQDALIAHGYDDVFCADTSDRRTLVVIHPDVYAGRVDDLVRKADPAALLTARSSKD
jgi:hypothetical protein